MDVPVLITYEAAVGAQNSAASWLLDVVTSIQERAITGIVSMPKVNAHSSRDWLVLKIPTLLAANREDARFVISKEKARLPNGRAIVRGTRTSTSGETRSKKHVFIEVECHAVEEDAVLTAITVILQQRGRIEASIF